MSEFAAPSNAALYDGLKDLKRAVDWYSLNLQEQFAKIDNTFAKMDGRFAKMEWRLDAHDRRFDRLDQNIDALTRIVLRIDAKLA